MRRKSVNDYSEPEENRQEATEENLLTFFQGKEKSPIK